MNEIERVVMELLACKGMEIYAGGSLDRLKYSIPKGYSRWDIQGYARLVERYDYEIWTRNAYDVPLVASKLMIDKIIEEGE